MATVINSETDTIETNPKSGMELTEREKAIAAGRDPDEIGAAVEDDGDEVDDTEVGEDEDTDDDTESDDTEVSGSDWITDDLRELAQSYGMDEEAISAFEDEKDFRRFASIYEKQLGKAKPAKEPPAEKAAETEAEATGTEDDLDPASFEQAGYDAETVKVVKAVASLKQTLKALTERNEQLEQRLLESDRQRETDALQSQIDEMGGRFGSGTLNAEQRKARERLIEAVQLVKQDIQSRGEQASTSVVLRRAELLAFGPEIIAEAKAKEREQLSQTVKKQSAKRRSVGRNTKPPTRRELPGEAEDPVKAIADLPEIKEFWDSAQF